MASRSELHAITPIAPKPVRAIMPQIWRRLTFLHWRYPTDVIRPLIPHQLELDTFDGSAWVGLVPFEIYGIPGLPHFPETNLRTYVVGPDGSRAVLFFSLEAARLAAVIGARIAYHLPYFWSRMRVRSDQGIIHYSSRRRWPHDRRVITEISIRPGAPFGREELNDIDHFLTARFRLYTIWRGRVHYASIEHPPWPLARATLVHLNETIFQANGIPAGEGQPLIHYSDELTVKIGRPELH